MNFGNLEQSMGRLRSLAGRMLAVAAAAFAAAVLALVAIPESRGEAPAEHVEPSLVRFAESKRLMGVEFEVLLYAPTEVAAERGFTTAFDRIRTLEKIFSDYDPTSEANQIADHLLPLDQASPEMQFLLQKSALLQQRTGGAFDPWIGAQTKLWRRARRQNELPDPASVKSAVENSGRQAFDRDAVEKKQTNVRLDFGGIAKGYAAEESLRALHKLGLSRALVRGSGDIAAGDAPPGAAGWVVGIAPLNPTDAVSETITIVNRCVSTSGDARQHLIVDGKRYSHIIDPRTGEPVAGRSSVTVVAPAGWQADGLATAFSVVGPEAALKIVAREEDVQLLMITEEDGQPVRHASQNWRSDSVPNK